MIEIMKHRTADLDSVGGSIDGPDDDYGLALKFFELIKSLPEAEDGDPSPDDVDLLAEVNRHLFSKFSEQSEPNPFAAEQLLRGAQLIWDKLSPEVQDKIVDNCYMGANDLVDLWIKGAQSMAHESYGCLLEIYQWIRDEFEDEEWAEEFREDYEIHEDDW